MQSHVQNCVNKKMRRESEKKKRGGKDEKRNCVYYGVYVIGSYYNLVELLTECTFTYMTACTHRLAHTE